MSLFALNGKTVLVTGASRGLGRGIALTLAQQGADVGANYRSNKDEAERVAEEIRRMGRRAVVLEADVGRQDDVLRMFVEFAAALGPCDILVNNAGTTRAQDIFETTEEDWDFILQTNLKSCFLCSKAAMQTMRERGRGRIVNITSVVAQRGAQYGHVHYAATKAGILGVTKTLARTGSAFGVTVNAVAPGIIETELLRDTHGETRLKELSAGVPMGLGTVEDVGAAVAFMASDEARYITGATLDVNGGMHFR